MTTDRPHGHRRSIRLPGYDYAQPGAYFVTICTHDGECLFDDPILRRVAETMWQQIPSHFGQVSTDALVVMPNHMHGILFIWDVPIVGAKHSTQESPLTTQPTSGVVGPDIHNAPGNASPLQPRSNFHNPSGNASPSPHDHIRRGEDEGNTFPTTHSVTKGSPPLTPIMMTSVSPGNALPLPRSGAPPGSLGAIIGNYKSITTRRINRIRKTPGMTVWQRNYYEHVIRSERALNAIRQYILDNPARWRLDKYNTLASGPDPMAAELWRLLKEETS